MATVFGASLSPMEREAQLLFMECEMNSSKIEALQDITNAQYERALTEAEYIVLKTGGTYDDLDRLMMEAAAQQGEKKVGIIRTILNSIGSAISSIGNWIQRNLGANNERLNGVPAGTTVDGNGYDLKVANEGLTGLPKVFNRLKEIIAGIKACMSDHKEFTITSLAVGAVAAVLVRGSKEEEAAKEEPVKEVTKETVQDILNRYLKLQGTANELTGECDTLLKQLGLPLAAVKAKAEDIAGKKNAKREEKANAAAGDNGGQQDATEEKPAEKTESADDYGLGAYDGLFMEATSNNRKICPKCHTSNQKNAKFCGNCGTAFQVTNKPASNQNAGSTNGQPAAQQKNNEKNASGQASANTGSQPNQNTKTQTNNQPKEEPKQNQKASGSTNGQSGQPKEEPKKDTQQTQASGSTGEQKTDGRPADNTNAQGNTGDNAQAEEKPATEWSKLPWYDKGITALQATLETMAALVTATGKSVLNIVAKVLQWDKIKAKAGELEQRVMDGKGNGKDDNAQQSNEGNDQQPPADNGGEANADNGQESAVDDTITGDYTTEAPDLFGIRDEYNAMMESPSIEELNSFEAIFDNL